MTSALSSSFPEYMIRRTQLDARVVIYRQGLFAVAVRADGGLGRWRVTGLTGDTDVRDQDLEETIQSYLDYAAALNWTVVTWDAGMGIVGQMENCVHLTAVDRDGSRLTRVVEWNHGQRYANTTELSVELAAPGGAWHPIRRGGPPP